MPCLCYLMLPTGQHWQTTLFHCTMLTAALIFRFTMVFRWFELGLLHCLRLLQTALFHWPMLTAALLYMFTTKKCMHSFDVDIESCISKVDSCIFLCGRSAVIFISPFSIKYEKSEMWYDHSSKSKISLHDIDTNWCNCCQFFMLLIGSGQLEKW